MTQGYANGWSTRHGLDGVHHIFIYHQICVHETNAIDSCKIWIYWKNIVRPHVIKAFGTSVVHSFVLYGSVMVLKRALYGLKAASNSF